MLTQFPLTVAHIRCYNEVAFCGGGETKRTLILFIAQAGFLGRLPLAPGTAGSLAGVIIYLVLSRFPLHVYVAITLIITAIGIWASGKAEEILAKKDHPSIVIDEIAGFLVTMFLLPERWEYVLSGFLLFRFFDLRKPFPLNRLQGIRGGLGVMMDDIGAGVYANTTLQFVVVLMN